jgi:hypothetical protein
MYRSVSEMYQGRIGTYWSVSETESESELRTRTVSDAHPYRSRIQYLFAELNEVS